MKEKIQISSVQGNRQWLDGGAMFGNAPRAVWEKWTPPDAQSRIELACRCLLIETPTQKVLCEAGIGAFFEPKLANRFGVTPPDRHCLLESLEKLGLSDSDIDVVILSHLHFDHAGGILPAHAQIQGGNTGLLFPNAQFIVGREAWERAKAPHFRDRASFIPGLTDKLVATGRLHIVDGEKVDGVLDSGFSFKFTSGHTPGHMHTLYRHQKNGIAETLFFAGDLIPGTAWVHVPITMGYDRYPERVIDEKLAMYSSAVKEKWWIFYTHDSKVSMSQLADEGGKVIPLNPQGELVRHEF